MMGLLLLVKAFWQWFKKPENAILAILILIFVPCCIIDLCFLCPRGLSFAGDLADRPVLYSSLLEILATVFVLIVSLLFVAVQLSAQAYTPRVTKKHFESLHFIFISITYLVTILYLIFISGGHDYFATKWITIEADLAVLLSLFCFTLLIPLVIRTYKLMRPKYLLEELVYDISQKDFERIYWHARPTELGQRRLQERKLEEKLQPIFDIIRSAALRGDVHTAREGFGTMNERFGNMIRRTQQERLSQQMARTLSQRMLEIGLFANHEGKIELTMETFLLFQKFLQDFGKAERRASAIILFSQLKDLKDDFELRYPKDSYPKQWREVTRIFIKCRGVVATIIT